jgi:flagellar M-ring protein FliF
MAKLLANLGLKQRITILVAVLLAGGGLFALLRWKREADFKPLFTEMAAEDAGAVVQKLKEAGVPYRLSENGATVMVPSDRIAEWRLGMAAAGLPKSGRIGFELFDKANFGATEFTEHINFRRALEGELERSVMSLAEVEQARVHLTFPKDSVFVEARQPAKGSVMVKLRPGAHLDSQNVLAICHLVASAVEGLAPEGVSVLDMRGNLLSRPRHAPSLDTPEPSEALLDYRQKLEAGLLAKINATLEPLVGADKFRAGVSVECDFTAGEQSEESFDPTHSVMASSEKTEDAVTTASSGGVPGAASNLPRPATARASGGSGGTTRRTENVIYQTSRTTRHVKLAQGAVKRLSISILLDNDVHWEGQGANAKRVLVPPSPERLKSIKDLVTAATGFMSDRGDQIVVETQPFESTLNWEPPAPPAAAPGSHAEPAQKLPGLLGKLPIDQKLVIPVLAAAGLLLLLLIGVIVMLMRGRKKRGKVETQAAVAGKGGEPKAIGEAAPSASAQIEAKIAERESQQRLAEAEAINALKLPPVATKKSEVLTKHLRENVKKEPGVAAQVLLGWMRDGES